MSGEAHSIDGFLEALASRTPAPGGGAASALCGAVACALGEMVVQYSLKSGLDPADTSALESLRTRLKNCRSLLRRCMEEDAAAYEALVAARREMRNDPGKSGAYQSAVLAATSVPLETVAGAVTALAVLDELGSKANRRLASDLAAAAALLAACVESAACQVNVNLPELEDETARRTLRGELEKMMDRGRVLAGRIKRSDRA